MPHYHAVVWIDHAETHVMRISPDDVESSIDHPAKPHQHLHSKRGTVGARRAPEDQYFYHEVVEALKGAQEILVVGPSDGQLVAYARKYFTVADRLQQ